MLFSIAYQGDHPRLSSAAAASHDQSVISDDDLCSGRWREGIRELSNGGKSGIEAPCQPRPLMGNRLNKFLIVSVALGQYIV